MNDKIEEIENLIFEIIKENNGASWSGLTKKQSMKLYGIIENQTIPTTKNMQVKSIKVSSAKQLEKIMEMIEDISDENKVFLA